jgi:hypothetical protein
LATQSTAAKLQIILLSARLLTLSHLSSLSTHRRPLVLLFRYITTLARYDLNYEVRDRARFIKGLLDSGGISEGPKGADIVMDVADFNRGENVEDEEDAGGDDEVNKTLTGDQIRDTLFASKIAQPNDGIKSGFSFLFSETCLDTDDNCSGTANAPLASMKLATGRRLAGAAPLPPWPKTKTDSSVRDEKVRRLFEAVVLSLLIPWLLDGEVDTYADGIDYGKRQSSATRIRIRVYSERSGDWESVSGGADACTDEWQCFACWTAWGCS